MDEELFELMADSVIVEVTDPATGKVYRRELPIEYYENANFLRLRGENMDGSVAQLVFLSARGIERVKDLTGKGPDGMAQDLNVLGALRDLVMECDLERAIVVPEPVVPLRGDDSRSHGWRTLPLPRGHLREDRQV